LIVIAPLLGYCLAQTLRDCRRKQWFMALWGALMLALVGWMSVMILSGPQH